MKPMIAFILATAFWVQAHDRPDFTGLQSEGMGKSGMATARGYDALFLNPAGLGRDSTSWDFRAFGTLGLNGVLLDYADWAINNAGVLGDPEELLKRMEPIDSKWAPFTNYAGAQLRVGRAAFAMVADVDYSVTAVHGALTPVLGVGAASDFIVAGGFGQPVGHGYLVGGSLQFIHMTRYPRRIIGFTDPDFFRVVEVFEDDSKSDIDKIQAASEVAEQSLTFGADFGVIKELPNGLSLGLALRDVPNGSFVNPGLGYERKLTISGDLGLLWQTNLEYVGLFHPSVRWYQQPKMGTIMHATIGKHRVGYIATGLNDGYPTFGVRMGWYAYFTYTYFTSEQGERPGQDPLAFHKLTFEIEF